MTSTFRIRFAVPLAAGRLRLIGSWEFLQTRASSQASVGPLLLIPAINGVTRRGL